MIQVALHRQAAAGCSAREIRPYFCAAMWVLSFGSGNSTYIYLGLHSLPLESQSWNNGLWRARGHCLYLKDCSTCWLYPDCLEYRDSVSLGGRLRRWDRKCVHQYPWSSSLWNVRSIVWYNRLLECHCREPPLLRWYFRRKILVAH